MCVSHQHTLLPNYLQFCTRCPKCLADLCFPEAHTSYSSVEVRCPICNQQFSQDVPQNRPHYNFGNTKDNIRLNANGPATAQDAKSILSPATRQILSLTLNDPTCRPLTQREETLYNLEDQINAAAGLTVLAALPIGIFLAFISVIPWMSLLVWPLLVGVLFFGHASPVRRFSGPVGAVSPSIKFPTLLWLTSVQVLYTNFRFP